MTTIYTIPARDVVPGMLVEYRPGAGDWVTLRKVGRDDIGLLVWMYGGGTYHCPPGYPTDVRLPGSSPRALCCSCVGHGTDGDRCDEPALHAADCPVAPRPGVHGGMRLWPAPFKGHEWHYNADGLEWVATNCYPLVGARPATVWSSHLRDHDSLMAGFRDMLLQSFCYPPTPPEPTGDRASWVAARARKGYR